jgi:predicted phage tail protein
MSSDAFSALEEAQVKRRTGYLTIAVLLTVLDGAVVVCYGWPVWTAWSEEIMGRGLLVLLAALGATSLANVWAQMVPAPNDPPCGRRADREQTTAGIQVEARGQTDV